MTRTTDSVRPDTSTASNPELGAYQLLEPVGAGGLGEVLRARDTVHGRTVAIKRVPAAVRSDAARLAALRAACARLSAVSHPGVAMLYEFGTQGDEAFVAHEFVAGQTLTQLLAGRALNARRAVDIAIEIADALAALHDAGLTHGDLRPDNVLITQKGHVKLVDAGLAAFTGGGATRATAAARLGSLPASAVSIIRYLSPEEALGEGGDARSDLFGLGLLLYEMLTGEPAFDRPAADDALLAVVREAAPLPSARQPGVPSALDTVVGNALAKPVDRRYQSALECADQLRAVKATFDKELERAPAPEPRVARRRSGTWWWVLAATVAAGAITWSLLR